jgi:hypothetical protein
MENNSSSLKTRIEHLSFQSGKTYMDIEVHTDCIYISIGGIENEKFYVTLEEWKQINKNVVKLLKQD